MNIGKLSGNYFFGEDGAAEPVEEVELPEDPDSALSAFACFLYESER
jgi:hypothetical protein